MSTMTVTQVRANMREALERVKAGEEIEITQNGEVVAVWLHPSKCRPMIRTPNTIPALKLREELARLRKERPPLATPGISAERADELIREIRAERDEDVWDRVEREMQAD